MIYGAWARLTSGSTIPSVEMSPAFKPSRALGWVAVPGRLRDLATTIRDFGHPTLVRIGGEFNGWWN